MPDVRARLAPDARLAKNTEQTSKRYSVSRIDAVDHWIAAVDADVAEIKRALFGVPRKPVQSERRDGFGRRLPNGGVSRDEESAA